MLLVPWWAPAPDAPPSPLIESTIGVEAGGRTGLTAIVSGVLFLVCIFLSPLFLMIPLP